MLLTTLNSNGKITIKFHKDWHPDRISKGYIPTPKNYLNLRHEYNLQVALLTTGKKITRS